MVEGTGKVIRPSFFRRGHHSVQIGCQHRQPNCKTWKRLITNSSQFVTTLTGKENGVETSTISSESKINFIYLVYLQINLVFVNILAPPPSPHTPPLVHKLFEGGKVMLVVRTQFSIKFVLVVVEHCCKLVIFWWTCLKVMITWTPVQAPLI